MTTDARRAAQERFAKAPVNRLMGLELEALEPDEVRVTMAPRPEFVQEEGVVHGAVLVMLADTAAVHLAFPRLADGERITSIEFKVNFLKPGRIVNQPLRASARPVRIGGRVIVVESRVTQGADELLVGLFTYLRFS